MDDKIKSLFEKGISLQGISRELDVNYNTVRTRAIRLGLYQPTFKKIKNGKAKCTVCKKNLNVDLFAGIDRGSYCCKECTKKRLLPRDLAKRNCSVEKYEQLCAEQENKCAICGSDNGHISKNGTVSRLAVDHCHETGKVRGLLCNSCNRGLGMIGDKNLQSAAEYIKQHQTK